MGPLLEGLGSPGLIPFWQGYPIGVLVRAYAAHLGYSMDWSLLWKNRSESYAWVVQRTQEGVPVRLFSSR